MAHHIPFHRSPGLAAVLAALCLTAACGSSDPDPGTASSPAPPSSSSAPSPDPVATETAPEEEAAPIDGTWDAPRLVPADFRRVLSAHGLGAHADTFLADLGSKVDLTLEIGGGFWTLLRGVDGQPQSVADMGTYEMQGKRVMVRPNSGGENLFRWSVTGDELTLELVSTTEPPYEGVPAETYQRGLYTTSSFQRAS